jgi:hypothetical protein
MLRSGGQAFGRKGHSLTNNGLASPFYNGGRLYLGHNTRRVLANRTISVVLVVLVHVFFFFFFALSVLKLDDQGHRMVETILLLPPAGNDQIARDRLITPEVKLRQAPLASTAPIALPKLLPPPPPEIQPRSGGATPGDILGAVGQTLACAAGNFEHLTQPERERCRYVPWVGARLPSGNIVLLPDPGQPRLAGAAPPEFRVSGRDQIQRSLNAGGPPCPILQNTPCISGILQGGGPAGGLSTHE